jgi:hypothetical protein
MAAYGYGAPSDWSPFPSQTDFTPLGVGAAIGLAMGVSFAVG